jgi:hypothetical protein
VIIGSKLGVFITEVVYPYAAFPTMAGIFIFAA